MPGQTDSHQTAHPIADRPAALVRDIITEATAALAAPTTGQADAAMGRLCQFAERLRSHLPVEVF